MTIGSGCNKINVYRTVIARSVSDVAIPIGFRNVQEIATPVCALVRNDIFRRHL